MIDLNIFNDLYGLEIGGPSKSLYDLGIYHHISKLDGFNIFENNYWQHNFSSQYTLPNHWKIENKIFGKQYNIDISEYFNINKNYDFIISSDVIEHFANPIKNIFNMKKYLVNNKSFIFSIIPNYEKTFDRKRKLTPLDHIIEDYISNVDESDITHIQDQLENFDESWGGNKIDLIANAERNFETRVVHHHTYNDENIFGMFDYCGFNSIITNSNHNYLVLSTLKNK